MPTLEPVLDDGQFGSRPGRSTTHALIAIQHKWLTTLDKGGSVRSLFIDFRKAFDLVDHNILIQSINQSINFFRVALVAVPLLGHYGYYS